MKDEELRREEEARQYEEQMQLAAAKKKREAEEADREMEALRKEEEQRQIAKAAKKKADEEARRIEEEKRMEEGRRLEEARRAEAKRIEDERRREEAKRIEEAARVVETKAENVRNLDDKKRLEALSAKADAARQAVVDDRSNIPLQPSDESIPVVRAEEGSSVKAQQVAAPSAAVETESRATSVDDPAESNDAKKSSSKKSKEQPPDAFKTLTIIGIKCTNLMARDDASFFSGEASSDPYVKIQVAGQEKSTEFKATDLNPIWSSLGYEFKFPVNKAGKSDDQLRLIVYDYDFGKDDDFLGNASIPLNEITAAGKGQKKVLLTNDMFPDIEVKGFITISFSVRDG